MWLDDCRIPFVETDPLQNGISGRDGGNMDSNNQGWGFRRIDREAGLGRFTPNLLVCDDMLNDGNIGKKTKQKITQVGIGRGVIGNHDGRKKLTKAKDGMEMLRSVGDGGSNSKFYDLDLWFDKMIDKL